ncbi:hypothetical protein K504DRAFT_203737 [Pleomassaria siparia CBS 279.74]|uniref:Uncharacterized protein n=1 Tax=Pleomassaria siparia CBS 279.74 TaxID=1314801 RepID=A0A6G1KHZ3_9PLEO|nr:hypothetical protein K504DRAFT_203737 [Pleomassaria siparia CBS 279.74]
MEWLSRAGRDLKLGGLKIPLGGASTHRHVLLQSAPCMPSSHTYLLSGSGCSFIIIIIDINININISPISCATSCTILLLPTVLLLPLAFFIAVSCTLRSDSLIAACRYTT